MGARERRHSRAEAAAPATVLVAESRADVAAAICDRISSQGACGIHASTIEEVTALARQHRPAAVVANLGFERRGGLVAALASRGLVPDALMLVYCQPCDSALVPAALRIGLGCFLVSSASMDWVTRLMPGLCRAAVVLESFRRERSAFEPAGAVMLPGALDSSGLLIDVEVSLIRAALSQTGTIRGAARMLRMHERTLRGRIEKLGVDRRRDDVPDQ